MIVKDQHASAEKKKETMSFLKKMPLDDKETLRFFAEQLHAKNGSLKRSTASLISVLQREQLQNALKSTTEAMREAEEGGNDKEVERLSEEARLLTGRIAKLDV